jgi:sulfate permease, SulP family
VSSGDEPGGRLQGFLARQGGRLRRSRRDAVAGVVLGVESVPDGLASGLLAGVNPLAGLYGYLYGMVGAACLTSTTFMAVQATGAMALVVADVDLASPRGRIPAGRCSPSLS